MPGRSFRQPALLPLRAALAFGALVLGALPGPARADVIRLKVGTTLRGDVVSETDAEVVFREKGRASTLTFRRSDIASLTRDKPPAAAPGRPAGATAAAGEAVYLRDGRRVPGAAGPPKDGRLVVASPLGPLTFPEWLVDRSGDVRDRWERLREYGRLDAPEFLDELRRRREIWDRDRGRQEAEPPPAVKAIADDVEAAAKSKDLRRLGDAVDRLERAMDGLRGPALEQARKLAAQACREAADVERAAAAGRPPVRASEWLVRAHRHAYSLEVYPDRAVASELLHACFADDPYLWGPPLKLFEAMEHYAVACAPAPFDGDSRWNTDGVDWPPDEGRLPRKFRIVAADGTVTITAGPDTDRPYALSLARPNVGAASVTPDASQAPAGIASLWVPDARVLGTVGVVIGQGALESRESGWSRIYWCPVARQWKHDTVPERLLGRARAPAYEYLYGHRFEEEKDLSRAFHLLRDRDSVLDSLALHAYDPGRHALIAHETKRTEEALAKADRLLRDALAEQDRSLRRRARMQRGFDRLRQIDALFAAALAGHAGDFDAVMDARPVRRASDRPDEKQAILAALDAFAVLTRIDTMAGSAIDKYADDRDVTGRLLEMAKDELVQNDRSHAVQLLQKWKNPLLAAYLEGEIARQSAAGDAGAATSLYRGTPAYWEKQARQSGDPALRSDAIEKLGLVEDKDAAAAVLARLAPELPTPDLQVKAMEALRRTRKPDVAAGIALKLRYPAAREKVWGILKDHDHPRAPAVAAVVQAQEDVWKWKRRKRGEPASAGDDPEAFRGPRWGKLEASGALAAVRKTAGGDGFERDLRALLDPVRLGDDRMLQDVVGRAGNDAAERLAACAEVPDLTKDLVRKVAAEEPGQVDRDDIRVLLVSFGDAAAIRRCEEAIESKATEGTPTLHGAIRILGYARDRQVAEFLMGLLDERRTAYNAIEALQRLTGRKDLKSPEEWKAWNRVMATE